MFHWQTQTRPILALAPMAGYTDSAFRQIIKEIAPQTIVFTELVSADGLSYHSRKTQELLAFNKKERPIIMQLFGKRPEHFIKAAKICEELGADGLDLNMGCPARKVVGSSHGGAILKNPQLAFEIVAAVAQATKLDVSVKTRLGFENAANLTEFAQGLEKAGAKLITVHGRTVKQGFAGKADLKPIYELKKHLKIPVIGNGDISSAQDALKKLKNLDGLMVGRATFGNPWLMAEIAAALAPSFDGAPCRMTGQKYQPPQTMAEKTKLIIKHARLNVRTKGEKKGILEMRKHLSAYIKGIPNASQLRNQLVRVETLKELKKLCGNL